MTSCFVHRIKQVLAGSLAMCLCLHLGVSASSVAADHKPLLSIYLVKSGSNPNELDANVGETPDLAVHSVRDVRWLGHDDGPGHTVITGMKIYLPATDVPRFAAFTSAHLGEKFLLQVPGALDILLPIQETVSDGVIWIQVPNAKTVLNATMDKLSDSIDSSQSKPPNKSSSD